MLNWLDGRNASSYKNINWTGNTLSFTVAGGTGATGLTGMLPTAGPNGTVLSGLTRSGNAVSFTTSTIKGLEYASFSAADGDYVASYSTPGSGALTFSALSADTEAATSSPETTLSWTTSRPASTEVQIGTSATALNTKIKLADTTRRHSIAARHLKPGTKYYYRVVSTDLKGRSDTYPATSKAPAVFTTPVHDSKAPKITAARVTPLPGGIATVRWSTNEPSTAEVRIGTSRTNVQPVAEASELATDHALVLTGLDPGKTYVINGVSTDAAGNSATSGSLRFVTPAAGVSDQSAPGFKRGTVSGAATVDDQDPLGRVTLSGGTAKARSGTFTSGLLDARVMAGWDRASWDAGLPAGTAATLQVRTGSTSTPDASWTGWTTVPKNHRLSGASRYLQYRVTFTARAGAKAPSLWAVGFSNNGEPVEQEVEGH
jgi:hypothetical protein